MTTPPNPQPATPSAEALKLAQDFLSLEEPQGRRERLALLIDQHTAAAVAKALVAPKESELFDQSKWSKDHRYADTIIAAKDGVVVAAVYLSPQGRSRQEHEAYVHALQSWASGHDLSQPTPPAATGETPDVEEFLKTEHVAYDAMWIDFARKLAGENAALREENRSESVLIDRLSKLLEGVANGLRGPAADMTSHDYSRLPVEAAALKARLATLEAERDARVKDATAFAEWCYTHVGTDNLESLRTLLENAMSDRARLTASESARRGLVEALTELLRMYCLVQRCELNHPVPESISTLQPMYAAITASAKLDKECS